MPHPIWGPPHHPLTRVTFTLHLPQADTGRVTRLEAQGRSTTSRESLWHVSEEWEWTDVERGLQPSDAIHHVALVALQDQPTSQRQMELGLIGEGWEQLSLWP